MKLGLVGMTGKKPGKGVSLDLERQEKHEQIEDIFSAAAEATMDLLLFPGWTSWVPQDRVSQTKAIWGEVEWFHRRCIDHKIAAIFQVSHHSKLCDDSLIVAIDPTNAVPHVFVQQLFSEGGNAKKIAVDAQLRLIHSGQNRRLVVGKQKLDVALVICGEINFMTNRGNSDDVYVRHNDGVEPTWKDYDLLFNPAHTVMGNLGKLKPRWEWLSKGHPERLCLYTTNARPETGSWKEHIFGFRNGAEIITKDDFKKGSPTLCDCDDPNDSWWVVIPVEVNK